MNLLPAAAFLLGMISCGSEPEKKPPERLEVRHIPSMVDAVKAKDGQGRTIYRWTFRTEVENPTPVPLKVDSFACYTLDLARGWQIVTVGGEPYTAGQFESWYSGGDSLRSGRIPPGATAADDRNWIASPWAEYDYCLWRYHASDSLGNIYDGSEYVYPVPYYEALDRWAGADSSNLFEMSGTIVSPDYEPPGYALIRVTPFRGTHLEPLYATLSDGEGGFTVKAAAPGLYRIAAYSPRTEPASWILALGESPPEISVGFMMRPPHSYSWVSWSDSAEYMNRIMQIEQHLADERRNAQRFYNERSGSSEDPAPELYDWSEADSMLAAVAAGDSIDAIRMFAALMLADVTNMSGNRDAGRLEALLDIIPPGSPYWGAFPQLPSWLCARHREGAGYEYLLRFSRESPDRAVRAFALLNLTAIAGARGDSAAAARYFDLATSRYADVEEARFMYAHVDPRRISRIRKGEVLPPFEVTAVDGKVLTKDDFIGKHSLIHFWATWCGPCKKDMQYLHEAHGRFEGSGLEILSISFDRDPQKVDSFRRRSWPMPWDNVIETEGSASPVGKAFEVRGVPLLVLAGPDGKILEAGMPLRGDSLVPTLEKYLTRSR